MSKIKLTPTGGISSTYTYGPRLLNARCNGLSISPDDTFALTYNSINNTVDKIDLTENINLDTSNLNSGSYIIKIKLINGTVLENKIVIK